MDLHQEASVLIRQAQDAQGTDWAKAGSLAATLRSRFPDRAAGYQIGASSARALGNCDEAIELLKEGAARFPAQVWPLSEMAAIVQVQGHHDEAAKCAAELRLSFPDHPAGYRIGAASARASGEFDQAAALLAEGLARFPMQPWPLTERAAMAMAQGDAEEAIRLASELRRVFPDHLAGYQFGAAGSRKLRQFEAAAALLMEAAARFPAQAWLYADQAGIAMECGHFNEAILLTAELRRHFPDHQAGYRIGASALTSRNRLNEAEALLREALHRFPAHADFERQLSAKVKLQAARAKAAQIAETLNPKTAALKANVKRALDAGPKVVVLLGMHRAGTSLCTRLISNLGIELGAPLMAPNFDNPDGFQEHKSIVECHDALLGTIDAEWDTLWLTRPASDRVPPDTLAGPIREQLKQIVTQQLAATGGVWAFKDPRTIRFLPMWQEIFDDVGVRPIWLLAVRDPRAVAASLFARNGLPLAVGELLWAEHYLEALRHLGSRIGGIIHYEKWFSSPLEQLHDLAAMLGGTPKDAGEAVAHSIKRDMRHNVAGQDEFALELAREIYAWLAAEAPKLNRLQWRAEAVWRGIDEIAREAG